MSPARPIRQIILATDEDAKHYTVYDGVGQKIGCVVKVDTDANLVTVFACDFRGLAHVNDLGEIVTVTYRPPGGVVVIDDRNEEPQ